MTILSVHFDFLLQISQYFQKKATFSYRFCIYCKSILKSTSFANTNCWNLIIRELSVSKCARLYSKTAFPVRTYSQCFSNIHFEIPARYQDQHDCSCTSTYKSPREEGPQFAVLLQPFLWFFTSKKLIKHNGRLFYS